MGWRFLSALVPFLCGFLAVLISNLPLSLTGGLVPAPLLGLVPIYFWCLVRPDLMTPAAAFAIGLLQDIMAGGPPGVWTLSFVVTYARDRPAARRLRRPVGPGRGAGLRHRRPGRLRLAPMSSSRFYYWHMPLVAPIVAELAMTVLFYIPGAYVVGAIHRRLVGPLAERFLMPLFDKKDKCRYATFTRRSLAMGGGMSRGLRGAGRPALSAPDPRRRRVHDRGRGQPHQRAAAGAAARPHLRPLRRRAGQQPAQLPRAAGGRAGDRGRRGGARYHRQGDPAHRRAEKARAARHSRRTRNSCRCRWRRISPGRNSPASICICPICPACSPMWARPATIPSATRWCISWAMSPRCRRTTRRRMTTIRC